MGRELTMLSFDDDIALDPVATMHLGEVVTEVVYSEATKQSVVEPVTKTHLVTSGTWTWRELRDYVVDAIFRTVGAFPRNPITEASIFKSFVERWGDKAEPIARYAVEEMQCWWQSSPLSVNRFTIGSDPFFGAVIATRV